MEIHESCYNFMLIWLLIHQNSEVGDCTQKEIGYAKALGKEIIFLEN